MAKTKTLALTTTPQVIVPKRHCRTITIKEDGSVAGFPTTALVIQAPTNADDPNTLGPGSSYTIHPEYPNELFVAGVPTTTWVSVGIATTGTQDEQ